MEKFYPYPTERTKNRPVGWGGSRGSNEPPKIFEVGILGGIEKIKQFTKKQEQTK